MFVRFQNAYEALDTTKVSEIYALNADIGFNINDLTIAKTIINLRFSYFGTFLSNSNEPATRMVYFGQKNYFIYDVKTEKITYMSINNQQATDRKRTKDFDNKIPAGAFFVGGADGGVYVTIKKENNKNIYNAIIYSDGQKKIILFKGKLQLNTSKKIDYKNPKIYSAWDGDILYLTNGDYLKVYDKESEFMSVNEIREIIKLSINLPELQQYFHIDSDPSRIPLIISEFRLVKQVNMTGITKFGKDIVIKKAEDLRANQNRSYLQIENWSYTENTLKFQYLYTIEGILVSYGFVKKNGAWVLENSSIKER